MSNDAQTQIDELKAQLAQLQRQITPGGSPAMLDEEIVIAISAAVAGYLGERAKVTQIRAIRTDAWANAGRQHVFASHARTRRNSTTKELV